MRTVALFHFAALAAGCEEPTVSTAEMQDAAKEHVRDKLGLDAETALFSTVWVGRSSDDEPVLCGRVAGDPKTGPKIAPRRFIAALEPPRWLLFEPATNASLPSQPDMFVEWATACAGRRTV